MKILLLFSSSFSSVVGKNIFEMFQDSTSSIACGLSITSETLPLTTACGRNIFAAAQDAVDFISSKKNISGNPNEKP